MKIDSIHKKRGSFIGRWRAIVSSDEEEYDKKIYYDIIEDLRTEQLTNDNGERVLVMVGLIETNNVNPYMKGDKVFLNEYTDSPLFINAVIEKYNPNSVNFLRSKVVAYQLQISNRADL